MKELLRKFRTAASLSAFQWKLLLEATLLLSWTRIRLFFWPPRSVGRQIRNAPGTSSTAPRRILEQDLLRCFRLAVRYQLGRPTCLALAMAQRELLCRYGSPAVLRISVRREGGQMQAHAWVEVSDQKGSGRFDVPAYVLLPLPGRGP